jgi:hypothetical protein
MNKLSAVIKKLSAKDKVVSFGPHYGGLCGFWCAVQRHDSGNNSVPKFWDDCGHGHTLKEALRNAIKVSNGGASADSELFGDDWK